MRNLSDSYPSNSIQHRESGSWLETLIAEATSKALQTLNDDWLFSWRKEMVRYPVFKLTTTEQPGTIQGLMSLEKNKGFFFVSLIENAPHNRGQNKEFKGVPGNLFAFACKLSDEHGFGGFVVFESKTALIEHYKTILGAQTIGDSNRMFIDEQQAQRLILFHFPKP